MNSSNQLAFADTVNRTNTISFSSTWFITDDDWNEAVKTCLVDYSAWYAGSISYYRSSALIDLTTSPNPLWTATTNFPRQWPSCCNTINSQLMSAAGTEFDKFESSLSSAVEGMNSAEKSSYMYSTRYFLTTATSYTSLESWSSCTSARTVLNNIWTWVDGYDRANYSIDSRPCPDPTMIYTTNVSVVSRKFRAGYTLPCERQTIMNCDVCRIFNEGFVSLVYWPVSLGWSGNTTYTIPPTETGVVTAEYWGTTLTSPTAYLRYEALYAGYGVVDQWGQIAGTRNPCPDAVVGGRHTSVIVPVPPEDKIITYQYVWSWNSWGSSSQLDITKSTLNFADLDPNPVPASLWVLPCLASHKLSGCSTIDTISWHTSYYQILNPDIVRKLDPSWSSCTFWTDYRPDPNNLTTWDPPHPLQPKPALVVTTQKESWEDATTTATPASRTTMFNPPTAPAMDPDPDPSIGFDDQPQDNNPTQADTGSSSGSQDGTDSQGSQDSKGNTQGAGGPTGAGQSSQPGIFDESKGDGHQVGSPSQKTSDQLDPNLDPTIHPLPPFPTTGAGTSDLADPLDLSNPPAGAIITIGSLVYIIHPSEPLSILPDLTLSAGGPEITISGSFISLSPDGVVINGTLTPFGTPTSTSTASTESEESSKPVDPGGGDNEGDDKTNGAEIGLKGNYNWSWVMIMLTTTVYLVL